MSINSIFAGSTPNSRETIRQQYLNTLTLDIANMTKNLNANKLFKANGSTGSEPADTRSATEKYEDLDNLKLQVRAGLKQITDGAEAERIVADITTAELQFLAGQLPFIIADLKPKWALGVPAGSFLPYLRKLMRKNIETEGVEYGLQSASNVGGGIDTTATNLISTREIEDLGRELGGAGRGASSRRDEALEKRMLEKLAMLDKLKPSAEDRSIVASLNNPDILDEYDEDVATVAQNLPSFNVIREAFRQVPYQAKMAKFDAIFDAVDWEMMRSLKSAVSEIRRTVEAEQPQQFRFSPEGDESSGLTPLGGTTLRDVAPLNVRGGLPIEQQPEGDLPSAYTRPSTEKLTQLSSFAEEITPEDFRDQPYNVKMELLRSYADEGKFNNMDASFLQMINAIIDGQNVPERDMDTGYTRFFRLKQLGGLTEKGEMQQLPASKVFQTEPRFSRLKQSGAPSEFQTESRVPYEQVPPTRPPYQFQTERMPEEEATPLEPSKYSQPPYSNFGSMSAKSKRLLLTQMLTKGEFSDVPDFEDVATEIVSTKNVPDEYLSNFFNAFLHHIGVGGAPLVAMPEEEATAIAPPPVVREKKTKPPIEFEEVEDFPPSKFASLDEFKQLSNVRKKAMLTTLQNVPPDIEKRISKLASAPQAQTMNQIYDDFLQAVEPPPMLTKSVLKQIPSSEKKGGSPETTEVGSYATPSKGISEATQEFPSKTPQKASKVVYPTSVAKFKALNNAQKVAVLDKALGDDLFSEESVPIEIYEDIKKKEISGKWKDLFAREYVAYYEAIMPIIKEKGIGGMGLPAPHHILGKHGYGLHHTKSPLMGEWGSGLPKKKSMSGKMTSNDIIHIDFEKGSLPKKKSIGGKITSNDIIHIDFEKGALPKGKKKGNIIFGLGLARPTQPPPRMGKNINLAGGIESEPAYVKFGTHLLNKHRLKDNVVMMRTIKGGAIVNIPTQKISGKLAKVLHCISGGGIPQFESVMDLTDGDKALLHQIAKTSKVSDRLSVPNPNKSKLEEEDNRFNILRGEVSIGNDNPSVIKEFKVLLLKFMREGRVPTGQGKAIMEELLLLGY